MFQTGQELERCWGWNPGLTSEELRSYRRSIPRPMAKAEKQELQFKDLLDS
eukprot:TCALIF_02606-PA protein Name:"Protein of unknown function" AED:0.18 eAED:0.29 QI:0/0/0/1/0/0.5/2/0/50